MALDGATLHLLRRELAQKLVGARVDKVQQPSREELVLTLRGREGTHRLLISTRAACPRINITPGTIENPAQPPMFCMLMRKHLGGARLDEIRQQGMDRVLMLDFEAVSELDASKRSYKMRITYKNNKDFRVNSCQHCLLR